MSTVVLLSGGVDSAYLLAGVSPGVSVFVNYGQPSADMERQAAESLCHQYNCRLVVIGVSGLLLGDMATGVDTCSVPARNLALIALAANYAVDESPASVWIGAAPQDSPHYPDCGDEFLLDAQEALHTGYGVTLQWSKATRKERIKALGNSVELCWSCYGSGPDPCGRCASCRQ